MKRAKETVVEHVIESIELTKRFDHLCAVDTLNIRVPRKTIFSLLGPNGAGKTTTVRLLNGILKPTSGRIFLFGEEVAGDGGMLRQRCGVQTDTLLYDKLTVNENLSVWGELFGLQGKELTGRIDELLRMFGLMERKHSITGGLSKGMKQKLAIARAVIHRPEILFLDEPTAGLDPEATEDVLLYLKRYVEESEHTVFLCSHRLEEVEMLSHQVTILYAGKVLASGSIPSLIDLVWKEKWIQIEVENPSSFPSADLKAKGMDLQFDADRNFAMLRISNRSDIPGLVEWMVGKGVRILSVRDREHSLQDTYIKLVSRVRSENEYAPH